MRNAMRFSLLMNLLMQNTATTEMTAKIALKKATEVITGETIRFPTDDYQINPSMIHLFGVNRPVEIREFPIQTVRKLYFTLSCKFANRLIWGH